MRFGMLFSNLLTLIKYFQSSGLCRQRFHQKTRLAPRHVIFNCSIVCVGLAIDRPDQLTGAAFDYL
jgi:hypothetical protein